MIRKLRLRFIGMSVAVFALVMLLLLAVVNVLNFMAINNQADQALKFIWENEGEYPLIEEKWEGLPAQFRTPEAPYENRFFSVLIDGETGEAEVNIEQIAAIEQDTAIQYATQVLEGSKSSGTLDSYRFYWQDTAGSDHLIVFLYMGRGMENARMFLSISSLIYVATLVLVLFGMILISQRAVTPIADAYEKQKRFIADAGHELKTPITIIDADSEVLKMEIGENKWLRDIRAQCRHMTELTGNLISLSHLEEDQRPLIMIDLPLSELVEEALASFKTLAWQKQCKLTSRIEPLISVCGNEQALRQLVSVLMDNALKYAEGEREIQVSLTRRGQRARLMVQNSCMPMDKKTLSHLFDRFYRVDQARTSGIGGYGIGLSIAKAIVEVHHGRITAASPDGHSLLMTVELPISPTTPEIDLDT